MEGLPMQRAATLVLFTLLATAMSFAQTGTSSNPPATPQTQSSPGTPTVQPPATGEDARRNPAQPQTSTPNATQPPTQNQQASPAPTTNQSNSGGAQSNTLPSPAVNDQVTAGTEIRAALDTPLSTKTSKPGHRFTATLTEPVRGSNGAIVIPAGARVEGEVAETEEEKTLPALRDKANLSLRFRDLVLPTGQTLPLTATLISVNNIGKSPKKADEEGQIQP